MKRKLLSVVALACVVFIVIGAWNYLTVSRPVALATGNQQVRVSVHYQHYVNASVLSFDLRETGRSSMMEVFGVLLQSARALRSRKFRRVELLYRGDIRFLLDGAYFKELGNDEDQQPMFLIRIRTFTTHLYGLDGVLVFPEITSGRLVGGSGLLGMLSEMTNEADQYRRQLEQFSNFQEQWYLNKARERR